MGDIGLELIFISLLTVIACVVIYLALGNAEKYAGKTRKTLIAVGTILVVAGMIWWRPPAQPYKMYELSELSVTKGVLREKSVGSGRNRHEILYLENDGKSYHFILCDYYDRVRNRLRDKEVTLWHNEQNVYQVSTIEKGIIYPLEKVPKRIFWSSVRMYARYLVINILMPVLIFLHLFAPKPPQEGEEKNKSGEEEREKSIRPTKENAMDERGRIILNDDAAPEAKRQSWLGSKIAATGRLFILCLMAAVACTSVILCYSCIKDDAKSNVRLAWCEHLFSVDTSSRHAEAMILLLRRAVEVAENDAEIVYAKRAWRRLIQDAFYTLGQEEIFEKCKKNKKYAKGEKIAVRWLGILEDSKDAFLAKEGNGEKFYREDKAWLLDWYAYFKYRQKGEWQEIIGLLSESIELCPGEDNLYAYKFRAWAYRHIGDVAAAQADEAFYNTREKEKYSKKSKFYY